MDPIEIQEKKRAAQRRLRAQRAKAGELRGRVVAISLICFVLLWGIVFVQMATGNDPVLGNSSSTAKGSGHRHRHRARPTVESDASTDSEEPAEEEFVEPEEEFSEEEVEAEPVEEEFVEEEPAPVTTSQS
jgi:cytoskeletal protein RodZ